MTKYVLVILCLIGLTFLLEANDLNDRQVKHLIIAPSEFLSQAQQLASFYYEEFGIERAVVDQQQIFNEMNEGLPSVQSIRDYIQLFFEDITPLQECSVLLVGSGTSDWESGSEKNKIMVFEQSDDNFVDFSGDIAPEIQIGRLPAKSIEELELMIAKIEDYWVNPTFGWWRNSLLLLADDEWKSGGLEGSDYIYMNHTAMAEDIAEMVNDEIIVNKVYGIEYDFDDNGNKPEATEDLMAELNDGQLVWFYVGHGNENVLGDEDYFRLQEHLSLLNNGDKLPLFMAATRNAGRFFEEDDCMSEEFLQYNNGGCIAAISSTLKTGPQSNVALLSYCLQNMLDKRMTLGAALLDAKINSGASLYNSKLYNLLGDPLLEVVPPESADWLTIKGDPDTLFAGHTYEFVGDAGIDFGTAEIIALDSE